MRMPAPRESRGAGFGVATCSYRGSVNSARVSKLEVVLRFQVRVSEPVTPSQVRENLMSFTGTEPNSFLRDRNVNSDFRVSRRMKPTGAFVSPFDLQVKTRPLFDVFHPASFAGMFRRRKLPGASMRMTIA